MCYLFLSSTIFAKKTINYPQISCAKIVASRSKMKIHCKYKHEWFKYLCTKCDKKFAIRCHPTKHININTKDSSIRALSRKIKIWSRWGFKISLIMFLNEHFLEWSPPLRHLQPPRSLSSLENMLLSNLLMIYNTFILREKCRKVLVHITVIRK